MIIPYLAIWYSQTGNYLDWMSWFRVVTLGIPLGFVGLVEIVRRSYNSTVIKIVRVIQALCWGVGNLAGLSYLIVFDMVTAVSGICGNTIGICGGREMECEEEQRVSRGYCVVYVLGICILQSFIV